MKKKILNIWNDEKKKNERKIMKNEKNNNKENKGEQNK